MPWPAAALTDITWDGVNHLVRSRLHHGRLWYNSLKAHNLALEEDADDAKKTLQTDRSEEDQGRKSGNFRPPSKRQFQVAAGKYATGLGKRLLTVPLFAPTRDKLLTDINGGLADTAVGNPTVTEEQWEVVDFVAHEDKSVTVGILVGGGRRRRRSAHSTFFRTRWSMCASRPPTRRARPR